MSLRSLLAVKINVDFKKWSFRLVLLFFIGWVIVSFYIPYERLTSGYPVWFFKEFTDYLIYSQIISTLLFTYLISKGHLSEIKNYLRQIIVSTSILVVFAFAFFQWTDVTTEFGQYGYYIENNLNSSKFYYSGGAYSDFEKETLVREAWIYNYDLAIQQIAIFGGFIFASTFLILMALGKKENTDK